MPEIHQLGIDSIFDPNPSYPHTPNHPANRRCIVQVYEYQFTRKRVAESPALIRTPRDIEPIARVMLEDLESEALIVVCMNARNSVIGTEVVYKGNVSASLVRVGEIFRTAIRTNAAGIVIAHNHPSGDPTPSPDDLHLTAECIAAGRLLDIDVLDHIVIGEDSFVSLRDRGIAFDRHPKNL